MLLRPLRILILAVVFSLAGCAVTEENVPTPPPEPLPNPAIVEAENDLAAAIALQAEWMVRLSPDEAETRSLSEILQQAKRAEENGDSETATSLARQVSRFARLGIDQARRQQNAAPFYPQ